MCGSYKAINFGQGGLEGIEGEEEYKQMEKEIWRYGRREKVGRLQATASTLKALLVIEGR